MLNIDKIIYKNVAICYSVKVNINRNCLNLSFHMLFFEILKTVLRTSEPTICNYGIFLWYEKYSKKNYLHSTKSHDTILDHGNKGEWESSHDNYSFYFFYLLHKIIHWLW